eukprot:364870-Chlamydomonas_euryale.AAC.16
MQVLSSVEAVDGCTDLPRQAQRTGEQKQDSGALKCCVAKALWGKRCVAKRQTAVWQNGCVAKHLCGETLVRRIGCVAKGLAAPFCHTARQMC